MNAKVDYKVIRENAQAIANFCSYLVAVNDTISDDRRMEEHNKMKIYAEQIKGWLQ